MQLNKTDIISTERLDLILMNEAFLRACLAGEKCEAEEMSGFHIPDDWLQKRWLMEMRIKQIQRDASSHLWLLRAIVLRSESKMIGHIGFHAAPGGDCLKEFTPCGVELGYTVNKERRRKGFATEAILAMMRWATEKEPDAEFIVSISPDNIPSLNLANRLGFRKVGTHMDEIDGIENIFLLKKPLLNLTDWNEQQIVGEFVK